MTARRVTSRSPGSRASGTPAETSGRYPRGPLGSTPYRPRDVTSQWVVHSRDMADSGWRNPAETSQVAPRGNDVRTSRRKNRARHRRRARHRPRDRAQARRRRLRRRRQLLQQPRRGRGAVRGDSRARAARGRDARRASAMPDSVDEMFVELRQALRPARHRREQRGDRRAEAGDGDDAQALALVHGDQRARTQPARAARAAADAARAGGSSRCRASARSARCRATASSARRRRRSRRWCARSRRSSGRAASASTR